MKRRAFLLQSGAGLAAAALPAMAQVNPAGSKSSAGSNSVAKAASGRGPLQHPGILQTRADLDFLKAKVKAGEEPWKSAWDRMQASPTASLDFKPQPSAHIIRGAFGAGQKGGAELSASASAVNNHVLQWCVTGNEAYAQKAIEILDAWSGTLADFFENDAMLLAGWTGGDFANAAEILRATYPKWSSASQTQFKRMLLTVYVPLLRMYYPEANGNWDAAMMYTLLAIGIYADDRKLMDEVYQHYRLGPFNSGITRYIYPDGQCEETTRDQGHVQLGLGYLIKTCVVAWNQGVDLWAEADNRLALGCEYTASLLEGDKVHAYGIIQDTHGRLTDIYEAVLQHHKYVKHIDMPKTEKAVQQSRDNATTALQFWKGGSLPQQLRPAPAPSTIAQNAGARGSAQPPAGVITVAPGESIQTALDKAKGGGFVSLAAGLHTLPATLRIPSGVTIAGTGIDCVVFLDPGQPQDEAAMVNADPDMHDVVLRDFVIEGTLSAQQSKDPNSDVQRRLTQHGPIRAGILLLGEKPTPQRNLRFQNLTVRHCNFSGVYLYSVAKLEIVDCDFSGNGGAVPPGPGKNHNLKLAHATGVTVTGSRFSDCMFGCGIELSFGQQVSVRACELARNGLDGIRIAESKNVSIEGCLAEGNEGAAIAQQTWMEPNANVTLRGNIARNNAKA